MMEFFGLGFEEAVAVSMIHSAIIASAIIIFGEPYAPGWITPALPLVLAYVLGGYDDPVSRWQAMTALSLNFAALLFILGITGLGKKFVLWLPDTLKAGIILGAAIAALKRVFVDDAERFLLQQPIAITLACAVCLIFAFSLPMQKLKLKYKMLPFAIGWPSLEMFLQGIPLAIITYVILFGDMVTGNEVIRDGLTARHDEHIDINPTRTHISVAIRNAVMGVTAPFFPTQGTMWTGVQVIIVQRWKLGKENMNSLHSGLASYYLMGLPIMFFILPLLTGLQPLLGIALSLTLVLTGFACAYVAMAIPQNNTSRGTVLLIGAGLAFFEPWVGLLFGVLATILLVGWDVNRDPIPRED